MKQIVFSENKVRSDVMTAYFSDICRYKVMSNEQVINALAEGKKEQVIKANLRLVVSVAKCYQGQGLSIDDLIQEGNIGLCEAVNKYDVSRGTMFSTCALQYIHKYICEAITNTGRAVRIPKYAISATNSLSISIDAPIGGTDEEGNERTMLDVMPSDSRTDNSTDIDAIKHTIKVLLSGLDEREKGVLCDLFGIGCVEVSAYTLAIRYGITEERVRQIKWGAIEKMKQLANKGRE